MTIERAQPDFEPDDDENEPIPCPDCEGTGLLGGAPCANCDGAGAFDGFGNPLKGME
jgi:hypothetical protein